MKMFQKEVLEDVSDHIERYYKVMGKPARLDTLFYCEVNGILTQASGNKMKAVEDWDAIGDDEMSDIRGDSSREKSLIRLPDNIDPVNLKSSVNNMEYINIDLHNNIKLGN
jgi:hypothetical protein